MKTIKVKFVDFWEGFGTQNQPNDFLKILQKRYEVEISDNPDYLFYSGFGNRHLKYDCIRIFYTGECYTPNFNECDYAIAFDRLNFQDRFLRMPLYNLFQYRQEYQKLINRTTFTIEDVRAKTGFCSFVVSNCFADDVRAKFFDMLSAYKMVSSGGRFRNNIGGPIKDKIAFQSENKFSIVFENTSYNGYCTEKLMEAFVSGTVPIYWGDPEVARDFNPESFINVHDFNNFDEVVNRVIEIDNDDTLYLKMLNANPIENASSDDVLMDFIFHIIDQDYDNALRRPKSIPAKCEAGFKLRYDFFDRNIYRYYSKIMNQITRLKTGTILSK